MAIRTNVMTDRSLSCRTLTMVASALSRVFGVTVTTVGTEAYTTPPQGDTKHYTINIPAVEIEDPKYLTLIRGYIDHEVGHVRFTDNALAVKELRHDSRAALWNILEDPYVEYKMGLCYMGCERNLRDLGRAVFSLDNLRQFYESSAGHTHVAEVMEGAFHNWLLFRVRSLMDPEYMQPLSDYMTDICTQFGSKHILEKIESILQQHDYHPSRTNTVKNLEIATEIYQLLCDTSKNKTMCSSPSDSESGGESGSSLRKEIVEALHDDAVRAEAQDNIARSQQNATMRGMDRPHTKFDISSQAAAEIDQSIEGMAGNTPMPQSSFECAGNQSYAKQQIGTISEHDKHQALSIQAILDLRLRSLLQNYVLARGGSAAAGKLDMHKLHRLAVNNTHIFKHRVEKRGVDTEVIVLVDVSGSMSGQKATMTTQAMYALMSSLSRIRGVRAGAFGFNADVLPCFVPMGGQVTDQMRIIPGGGTLLGEAVNACLSRFLYEEGGRQVLIILSDGDSYNKPYVSHILEKAKKMGVELAMVGILDSYITSFNNIADCRVIKDLKELPGTLFSILQDKLVEGGLR